MLRWKCGVKNLETTKKLLKRLFYECEDTYLYPNFTSTQKKTHTHKKTTWQIRNLASGITLLSDVISPCSSGCQIDCRSPSLFPSSISSPPVALRHMTTDVEPTKQDFPTALLRQRLSPKYCKGCLYRIPFHDGSGPVNRVQWCVNKREIFTPLKEVPLGK